MEQQDLGRSRWRGAAGDIEWHEIWSGRRCGAKGGAELEAEMRCEVKARVARAAAAPVGQGLARPTCLSTVGRMPDIPPASPMSSVKSEALLGDIGLAALRFTLRNTRPELPPDGVRASLLGRSVLGEAPGESMETASLALPESCSPCLSEPAESSVCSGGSPSSAVVRVRTLLAFSATASVLGAGGCSWFPSLTPAALDCSEVMGHRVHRICPKIL